MNIEELRLKLAEIANNESDQEIDHINADKLLLKFINDKEVTIEFKRIGKWYA